VNANGTPRATRASATPKVVAVPFQALQVLEKEHKPYVVLDDQAGAQGGTRIQIQPHYQELEREEE
jgi:hypothetical protein